MELNCPLDNKNLNPKSKSCLQSYREKFAQSKKRQILLSTYSDPIEKYFVQIFVCKILKCNKSGILKIFQNFKNHISI